MTGSSLEIAKAVGGTVQQSYRFNEKYHVT
jgi:hypothetical protein